MEKKLPFLAAAGEIFIFKKNYYTLIINKTTKKIELQAKTSAH